MTATFDQANNEILALFKTAWDTTGFIALYENLEGAKPITQVAHAKVTVRYGKGGQVSLANGAGNKRFERNGILTVQIFIPNGQGLSQGYTLGKTVTDAFEGKSTSPGNVWFRNVHLKPIGPDGEWYQLNAIVEFLYDEVK